MQMVYGKTEALMPAGSKYCPGCMHSTAHKIIAEVVDEMGMRGKTIIVPPTGCSILAADYWNLDMVFSLHGRTAAVATGVKRAQRDKLVVCYQGDGDAASIGLAESFYAANRGEPITVVMINNQIYGMTGGQMSPTTLMGQKSTTCKAGRDENSGYPVKLAEIIATLPAPKYVARFALHTPKNILQAKRGLEKAFKIQLEDKGYSYIELLSACPTNWGAPTDKTPEYMEKYVLPVFPVGELKKPEGR